MNRSNDGSHDAPADPLIDEVRGIRKELSDRFGNDVEKLAEYVRQVGDQYRREHPIPREPEPAPIR